MPVRKKPRRTEIDEAEEERRDQADPLKHGSVMCQLVDENGQPTGGEMVLPVAASADNLETLLKTLLVEKRHGKEERQKQKQRDRKSGLEVSDDDDSSSDDDDVAVPYAFFLGGEQITASVATLLHKRQKEQWIEKQLKEGRRVKPGEADETVQFSVPEELVLSIVYKPQAVFRVRAVTRCSATLDGHAEAVLICAFSPDGKVLATGSGDKTIRLWDVLTSTPTDVLNGHKHWVQVLSWSPNGNYLASGSRDGGLLCWRHGDMYTDFKSATLRGHSNYLSHISWEPLHVNVKCDRFVSASKDQTLRVWRVGAASPEFSLSAHTACVTCVKWGGMDRIYSSSQDRTIIVWDAQTGSAVAQLQGHGHWVNFIALNTDLILRSGAFDHTRQEFSTTQEAAAYSKKRFDAVIARAQTERVVSCSDDGTMFLWTPLTTLKHIKRLVGHQAAIFHIAFSPDGTLLASCGNDKSVKLWNGLDGSFICNFRGHVAAVYHVTWSLDSRMLISGSKDSTLKLWSVEKRSLKGDLPGHADEIFSTDWSPDGLRVATGGKDKKVRIWVH